jgi:hypothetical protein
MTVHVGADISMHMLSLAVIREALCGVGLSAGFGAGFGAGLGAGLGVRPGSTCTGTGGLGVGAGGLGVGAGGLGIGADGLGIGLGIGLGAGGCVSKGVGRYIAVCLALRFTFAQRQMLYAPQGRRVMAARAADERSHGAS